MTMGTVPFDNIVKRNRPQRHVFNSLKASSFMISCFFRVNCFLSTGCVGFNSRRAIKVRKSERDPLLGIFGHIVGDIDLRGQIHQFSSPFLRVRLRALDAAPLNEQLFAVTAGCLLKDIIKVDLRKSTFTLTVI